MKRLLITIKQKIRSIWFIITSARHMSITVHKDNDPIPDVCFVANKMSDELKIELLGHIYSKYADKELEEEIRQMLNN